MKDKLISAEALLLSIRDDLEINGKHFARIREHIDHAPDVGKHGRWVLTANEEHSNYRWNVTAECSECHHSKGEIYAAFFPGFPKDLARDVLLDNAKKVKLDNYCPNCGAKMDGENDGK